jgi:hypothetical protein
MTFNDEERAKSPAATAHTINNINIEQVGAFVQRADNSVVQGGVDSTLSLDGVRQLIKQVEELFPSADLPSGVKKNIEGAVSELKQAANAASPDTGLVKRLLRGLMRAVAPAGEHLIRVGVDDVVTKLIGN